MITSLRAKLCIAVIAVILMLPIIGIGLQHDTELVQFHRRALGTWPTRIAFDKPADYFAQARTWVADRVYPIRAVSTALAWFDYTVLRSPPKKNITLGDDEFVFLNGGNE